MTLPYQVKYALENLRKAGFLAYAVGGCVRDNLLGKQPNDWDITTSALPLEIKEVFKNEKTLDIGMKHGTITVIKDGMPLEITTFRIDGKYLDNRHPESVTFSKNLADDLSRRDFTINAMAYNEDDGIVDLFGGKKDLENKIVSAVGDAKTRFEEDGLRILRALRFASVLDFEIEENTKKAIHEKKDLLKNIAKERINTEFCKLLLGRGFIRILREFADVIAIFVPEVEKSIDFPQDTKYHCYDVWEHTLYALENAPCDLKTRLALLYHDLGKPFCKTHDEKGDHFFGHGEISEQFTLQSMTNLRFDKETIERVCKLVKIHDIPLVATEKCVKRLLTKMPYEDVLRLIDIQKCDRLAHAKEYRAFPSYLTEIPKILEKIKEENQCFSLKDLAINGEDLMNLGIPKGKKIGELLSLCLDGVIDGVIANKKEDLISFVKEKNQ